MLVADDALGMGEITFDVAVAIGAVSIVHVPPLQLVTVVCVILSPVRVNIEMPASTVVSVVQAPAEQDTFMAFGIVLSALLEVVAFELKEDTGDISVVQIPPLQEVIVVSIVSSSVFVLATSSSLSSHDIVAVVVASLVIVVTGTVSVLQTPPLQVVMVVSTVDVSVVVKVLALALIVVTGDINVVQIPPEHEVIVVSRVSSSVSVLVISSSLSSHDIVAVVVASLVIVVTGTVSVEQTPPGHVVIVVSTVDVSVVVRVLALAFIVVTGLIRVVHMPPEHDVIVVSTVDTCVFVSTESSFVQLDLQDVITISSVDRFVKVDVAFRTFSIVLKSPEDMVFEERASEQLLLLETSRGELEAKLATDEVGSMEKLETIL